MSERLAGSTQQTFSPILGGPPVRHVRGCTQRAKFVHVADWPRVLSRGGCPFGCSVKGRPTDSTLPHDPKSVYRLYPKASVSDRRPAYSTEAFLMPPSPLRRDRMLGTAIPTSANTVLALTYPTEIRHEHWCHYASGLALRHFRTTSAGIFWK